jgi:hypothetical protein
MVPIQTYQGFVFPLKKISSIIWIFHTSRDLLLFFHFLFSSKWQLPSLIRMKNFSNPQTFKAHILTYNVPHIVCQKIWIFGIYLTLNPKNSYLSQWNVTTFLWIAIKGRFKLGSWDLWPLFNRHTCKGWMCNKLRSNFILSYSTTSLPLLLFHCC